MATTKATTLAHTLGGISSDISTAEINRLDGLTGDIQTQITALDTAKAPKASSIFTGNTTVANIASTSNNSGEIGTSSVRFHDVHTNQINDSDIAYTRTMPLFTKAGRGSSDYYVYSSTSAVIVVYADERMLSTGSNIWQFLPPVSSGYSEKFFLWVAGGSQSAGNAQGYHYCYDRATAETYFTWKQQTGGWYGSDALAGVTTELVQTASGHTPRDRGLVVAVKHNGGGTSVLSLIMLEQRVYYT